MPASNAAFAAAFAPLVEVKQRGVARAATPADILELLEPPRYALKTRDGRYLAAHGKGWTKKQNGALRIDDIDDARQGRAIGLREYGVLVKIVRIRRRGTCGIESYRLRPDIDVSKGADGTFGLLLSSAEGMALFAALTGGADQPGSA